MGASSSTATAALEEQLARLTGADVFVDGEGEAGADAACQGLFRSIQQLPPKLLLRSGDVEQAIRLLTRAQRDLAAHEANRYRDEAARELRRLGRRVGARQRRAGRGAGLGALSGRELEIAECVALGHTNRQIADTLFLSQKTVEGHLTSVFAKLGVSSRAAVAEVVGRSRK